MVPVPRSLVEVAPGVLVATSAVYATTSTVVVGDDGGCLLVDPALSAGEIAALEAALVARGLRAVGRWSTHAHWDHLLTGSAWADVPTWSAADTGWSIRARDAMHDDEAFATWLDRAGPDDDYPDVLTRPPVPFPRGVETGGRPTLAWPGPATVVVTTHGHAEAHGSLVVPSVGVLVAGDMLSDTEIPMLDLDQPEPLRRYVDAVDALADAVDALGVRTVVPGHGTAAHDDEVGARFAADRAYLAALEAGRASDDPRLAAPWLAAVDERQRSALRR